MAVVLNTNHQWGPSLFILQFLIIEMYIFHAWCFQVIKQSPNTYLLAYFPNRKGGCLDWWGFAFPKTKHGAQHSWVWLSTFLPIGSSEWTPCYLCALPNEVSLSHEFSHFYPPNFLPSPAGWGVSEQLRGAWLLAEIKSQHLQVWFFEWWEE